LPVVVTQDAGSTDNEGRTVFEPAARSQHGPRDALHHTFNERLAIEDMPLA
jgi:hypothetical protein